MRGRAVGLVYAPGLEDLMQPSRGLVDVVEIEPEMFWCETERGLDVYRRAWDHVRALPVPKLVHGVGHAVGGSVMADARQLALLRRCADELDAAWASHHLAFNWFDASVRTCAGFFLPPRQTDEGVRVAAASIRAMAEAIGRPFAVETGVNYLKPREDELADGEFVARVCRAAECGVLLDLHNLWANERNGRQSIEEFLAMLPLEHVVEVHVAGGFALDGFWLDAHSGVPPAALLDVLDEVLPQLPNVRATCFEVLTPFVARIGIDRIAGVLERMRRAWDKPRMRVSATADARASSQRTRAANAGATVAEWEEAVGTLAIGQPIDTPLARELATDPGIALLRTLIGQARAGMITDALPITTRLLMQSLGPDAVIALFERFWAHVVPQPLASAEAAKFAAWVIDAQRGLPFLADALAFDLASGRAESLGEPVEVAMSIDPRELCRALASGELPRATAMRVIATVTPS